MSGDESIGRSGLNTQVSPLSHVGANAKVRDPFHSGCGRIGAILKGVVGGNGNEGATNVSDVGGV